MAARQDQSLKIGLIITSLLVFILGIVAYLMYSSYNKAEQRATDLATQKSSSDNAARGAIVQSENYLTALGFDPSENSQDITSQIDEDKLQYMSNFDEDSRTYRSVLVSIYEENQKIARQEAEAKSMVKELQNRLVALESEKDAQIDKFKATLDKTKQELASERTNFNQVRDQLEKQRAELTQSRERITSNFESRLASANANMEEARTELGKSERSRKNLLETRTLESPSFEVADGRITYVNQRSQTVWINLGEADSLRRQITFSVFESNLSEADRADKKGSIEITRLLGPHLAEAKISSDNPRNPILPGDQVYSQIWQRGKMLRFALTGFIDLDGDGQSDLQKAKDLIGLSGGVIDSSAEDDGQLDGEMTINTRYLVLGKRPTQPSKAGLAEMYDRMSKDANTLGVETISLVDFLNQMGYEPREETVSFGQGAKRTSGGPGSGGRNFRFRTP